VRGPRTVFWLYLTFVIAGLAYFILLGVMHR
jgi:hypothetical protein